MPQTVIVLGAGASKEVGLPVGAELKEEIARLLNIRFDDFGVRQKSGDSRIVEALRHHIHPDRNVNPHRQAACRISEAMPQAISIDNFIDSHRGDEKIEICGKLAIVQAILSAERRSKLYHDQHRGEPFQHGPVSASWFNGFFQLLTENCRIGDLDQRLSTVTLIVFNYDRCIEQYLYLAFQTYYGMAAQPAAALVKQIHIYHPYGSVGALPWYDGSDTSPFGHEPRVTELVKLAGGIKTFTEGTDPSSSDITAIRAKLLEADQIIFLGFAFHRLNLDLLWDKENRPRRARARCYATGKGISKSDAEAVAADLIRLGALQDRNVTIRTDVTCSELIREYWRSLSLL